MSSKAQEPDRPSGMGFLAYMAICLVVLIAAAAVWMWARSGPQEPPRPLPSAERPFAQVTPIPLIRAAERIAELDDEAARFTYDDSPKNTDSTLPPTRPPGYVYALARQATLAGRPTRLSEAAVLSRMAFEFHYSRENPFLSDLFINSYVTLFIRNAGLDVNLFASAAGGPRTIDEAERFLRENLSAGRPVLADHYEWGLFIGEEKSDDRLSFVTLSSLLKSVPVSEEKWRGAAWWLRPGFEWVHNLVAVTRVYEQAAKAYEAQRAAVAAAVFASRLVPDVADLPESYRKFVAEMPSGSAAYEKLAADLEAGEDVSLWLADFPIQRVRFARDAASAYFRDAAQHYEGNSQRKLLAAADAFRSEFEAWDAYIRLGKEGDEDWRRQKAQHVRQAAAAQQQALAALDAFYLSLTFGAE